MGCDLCLSAQRRKGPSLKVHAFWQGFPLFRRGSAVLQQMCILAPGLLGASLGQAVRGRGLARRLHVWARREETRQACRAQGWADAVFADPVEAAQGCDWVVVCTPVSQIALLAGEVAPALPSGALITDVGSTKGRICAEAAEQMPSGVHFVGSHPMAGSEKSGLEHADVRLFEGRTCFVTPVEGQAALAARVETFWQALGMRVLVTTPEVHDRIVAEISHLPHVLASVLSARLASREGPWQAASGQGLRDTTRIAAGDPGLWREILEHNRAEVSQALRGFLDDLGEFERALSRGDFPAVEKLLAQGKAFRDAL